LELKTTIRSDRARGAIRNLTTALHQHQGRNVPLAAVVTMEPDPNRLLSVSPQTGDTHMIFHVALRALEHAVSGHHGRFPRWPAVQDYLQDFGDLSPLLRRMS
jgi:hypothetical protein